MTKSLITTLLLLATALTTHAEEKWQNYVNTMIGTGAHYSEDAAGLWGTVRKQNPIPTSKLGTMAGYDQAHDPGQCIPAVLMPHGMNFWVAQTEDTEQKGTSPYYYRDEEIQGFRNSHWIVGGMTQDYGSFTMMPMGSELIKNPLARGSLFSHSEEVSSPSYYSVRLQRYGIKVEMTATSRAAIFRLTYDNEGDVYLTVNPNSDKGVGTMHYDAVTHQLKGSNPVHRIYQGWGEPAGFSGYYVLEVNKDIIDGGSYTCDSIHNGAYLKYHVKAGETVMVRAASSFTDIAHACANLKAEMPSWDFDLIRQRLSDTWEQRLGRIEAESSDTTLLTNFYTALYHASFLPHETNDYDGSYPSFGGGTSVRHTNGTYYDDYSLWDTYRALHPLMCLLDPQRAGDMVQSMLDKYDDGGWLPIFPCWNSYTSEMIGDHACSLVADAYVKAIRNFDIQKAYKALMRNAYEQPDSYADYCEGKGRRALASYTHYHYIPVEDSVKEAFHQAEQTSRTLEYAYDDYCLSIFAHALGHDSIADCLMQRSKNYKYVFNPHLGWMDGRHEDGSWVNGDPYAFQKYITEGKPCHYTWYVPHDVPGLVSLMGGKEVFMAKLDTLFDGNHYWHGNEPCHQISYLYNYIGMREKTQQRVRHIMQTEYAPLPDGLAGNDDAGQMSAWYIFSAMGFYPVCPGTDEYAIGAPCFDKLTIHNANGRDFIIQKGSTNTLNGKPHDLLFLRHTDITNGGTLEVKSEE